MKKGSLCHGHLVEVNVKTGYSKLDIVFSSCTESIVFVTMKPNIGGDMDAMNEFSRSFFTEKLTEKVL